MERKSCLQRRKNENSFAREWKNLCESPSLVSVRHVDGQTSQYPASIGQHSSSTYVVDLVSFLVPVRMYVDRPVVVLLKILWSRDYVVEEVIEHP